MGVRSFHRAFIHLRRGGLLIYPTETAYALGCDATNARAVQEIFAVKGRARGKPLPIIVASRAMAEHYVQFTSLARRLARQYWPGPLTLVLDGRRGRVHVLPRAGMEPTPALANGVTARDGTVALRVSAHPIARALTRRLGRPIVATSANRSGAPPSYSGRAALSVLAGVTVRHGIRLPVLDIGALPHRCPSTIVDARGDRPVVLRKGPIRV